MAEQNLVLKVEDMTCDHCAESVLRGIYSVPGVSSAHVTLDAGTAEITYDDAQANVEDFTEAIDAEGYKATAA
jgi:copper chaperone CopZ